MSIRKKLPKVKTVRNKCDSLLTPIIAKKYPSCFLCNQPTQVAHHFVHKSKNTRLRYDLDNLIALCSKCHQKLHHNESYWAGVIITKKGEDWFKELDKKGREIVKADVHWYLENFNRLTEIYESGIL